MSCLLDACNQGREPCPSPRICAGELPDDPDDEALGTMLMAAVAGVLAVVIIFGALGWLGFTLWPLIIAYFNN